ncbi:MAG TPA: glycosyltransferase family 39 protein [Steroidobacteraceae bacterium]|nr:glycosyltransferase family 39 protein [Steroidobacteraceae bacterium]
MSADNPRSLWLTAAALALLWCVGLFDRGYWTPDEPREAALAASVSTQALALPQLGGVTFAEKPPLTYWLAGASMAQFGRGAAAARLPQLGYALLAFFAVVALARALLAGKADARATARAAGMLFASGALIYQVQIWLDTDALLLAGVALALAGMYTGLAATARHRRLSGYLAMHAGLTLAFFGKNLAAWLVPVLAFLCFIAWERRWRELLRWEFWLGALLPLACISGWVLAVAARPDGARALRILFWNNLVGRVLPVAAEARYNYAGGHPNWPGRYFAELPLYLLPWTALAAYALRAAWRGVRQSGALRAAWRFALCAALPGLLLLSFATTGRSIYAAPCMIGFVLLIALWMADAASAPRAVAVTAGLIAALALLVLALTVALQWTVERSTWLQFFGSAIAVAAVLVFATRWALLRSLRLPAALTRLSAAWCLMCSLGFLSLFSALNRTQDLEWLAVWLAQSAAPAPLLLWNPDETTLGWAQLYLPAPRWSALDAADANAAALLEQQLQRAPRSLIVSPIRGPGWSSAQWLLYLQGRATAEELTRPQGPADSTLSAAGLVNRFQVERPGGRGYLVWQLPVSASPSP